MLDARKTVNYYAVVLLLRLSYLLRRGPLSEGKNVNGVCTRCAAVVSDFSRPWRNLPPTWAIHMATRRPGHNTPIHMDFLYGFP